MGYATTNPYTNEVFKTFPYATDAEVVKAQDNAHEAFLSWRMTTFSELNNKLGAEDIREFMNHKIIYGNQVREAA